MLSEINGMGLFGIDAYSVKIETYLSNGLPAFNISGLPSLCVKEAKDRVRAAIKSCGFKFPTAHIDVNLAPADVKKEGALYDLPIFMGILSVTKEVEADLKDSVFVGELSLYGEIRPVKGLLPMAIRAMQLGYKRMFIPKANEAEGAAVRGLEIYPVENVIQLVGFLRGNIPLEPARACDTTPTRVEEPFDYADVHGQAAAKRAMEVAAAGGHNFLLIGPPGSGKSMLAKRLPSILPDMTFEESMETTKIHSIAGCLPEGSALVSKRPFRSPHHTISPVGLSGGGMIPMPGELSLAHNGVLFLDELPEFSRNVMEILRQPLEDGKITIARASGVLTYPCNVILAAAMNPCPCGYYGHPTHPCTCGEKAVRRNLGRISGPLLDRLDLHIEVPSVDYEVLSSTKKAESSAEIRARVNKARVKQQERYLDFGIFCNAQLDGANISQFCTLDSDAEMLLRIAFENIGLSARAYHSILKVARTIADLEGTDMILSDHIAEAIQYRNLDRKYWYNK